MFAQLVEEIRWVFEGGGSRRMKGGRQTAAAGERAARAGGDDAATRGEFSVSPSARTKARKPPPRSGDPLKNRARVMGATSKWKVSTTGETGYRAKQFRRGTAKMLRDKPRLPK